MQVPRPESQSETTRDEPFVTTPNEAVELGFDPAELDPVDEAPDDEDAGDGDAEAR